MRLGRGLRGRVCWKIFFFTKVFVPWPKMCDWVQLTRRKKLNWNPWPGTVSKIVVFFTKAFVKKYKGKIDISVFCIFCLIFYDSKGSLPHRSICLIDTVLLIPILAYFMTFYVILHMSYVIKRRFMIFYDTCHMT